MFQRLTSLFSLATLSTLLLPTGCFGQSSNATISGSVSDQSGAVIPHAEITLKAVDSGNVRKDTSGPDGLFSFPNLQQGSYELEASAPGFRNFVQKGISIHLNEAVRIPVSLQLGEAAQRVEV